MPCQTRSRTNSIVELPTTAAPTASHQTFTTTEKISPASKSPTKPKFPGFVVPPGTTCRVSRKIGLLPIATWRLTGDTTDTSLKKAVEDVFSGEKSSSSAASTKRTREESEEKKVVKRRREDSSTEEKNISRRGKEVSDTKATKRKRMDCDEKKAMRRRRDESSTRKGNETSSTKTDRPAAVKQDNSRRPSSEISIAGTKLKVRKLHAESSHRKAKTASTASRPTPPVVSKVKSTLPPGSAVSKSTSPPGSTVSKLKQSESRPLSRSISPAESVLSELDDDIYGRSGFTSASRSRADTPSTTHTGSESESRKAHRKVRKEELKLPRGVARAKEGRGRTRSGRVTW